MLNYQKVLIALIFCYGAPGCSHSVRPAAPVHMLPVTCRAVTPVSAEAATIRVDPMVAAEVQIRSAPLFHQAELACRHKRFWARRRAAHKALAQTRPGTLTRSRSVKAKSQSAAKTLDCHLSIQRA